jgi:general secretion pathway protein M
MNPTVQALRVRWAGLAPREKLLVAAAGGVIGLALVWWIAIGPALSTLRTSDEQRRALDAQLQRMLSLQSQAKVLQGQPKQGREEAMRQLELAIRQRLGTTARTVITGDRVTVTLSGAPADAFAQWLSQARTVARTVPGEAHLTRNPNGTWDGSLVLTLPRS